MSSQPWHVLRDPIKLGRVLWPNIKFYNREEELIRSVWINDKTICVAGNKLGKDFTSSFIVLTFFLTRGECRIVTTSVDETQLQGVLWGEMRKLIRESVIPLDAKLGGPLIINHLHLKKAYTSGPYKGMEDGVSYCIGRVAKKGEGFLGHHIAQTKANEPQTLFVADEASGVDDGHLDKVETWAHRQLYIGNPYECSNAFFRESEAGDVVDPDYADKPEHERRYYTKVIRITGHESPNVRYALAELKNGEKPSHRILVPGVLSYKEYQKRIQTWDPIRKSISIDARFYKGAEVLLYPPAWLDRAHTIHESLRPKRQYRKAKAIGCDPGEGVAETAWYVVDEFGILDEVAYQTPNTAKISKQTMELMRKWSVPPEMVMFDAGGGGVQIADEMRETHHMPVKTVGFNESVKPRPKRGMTSIEHKIEQQEDQYAYVNRRAEMYGRLSIMLDPSLSEQGFGIPQHMTELRRQLAPIPKMYDKERLFLPPKNRRPGEGKESKIKTLSEIIGCSPDRADALVIALYCRDFATKRVRAGAA